MDAFSTGANIAAQVLKMGLKLILIFSEVDSPVAKLVSVSEMELSQYVYVYNNYHCVCLFVAVFFISGIFFLLKFLCYAVEICQFQGYGHDSTRL